MTNRQLAQRGSPGYEPATLGREGKSCPDDETLLAFTEGELEGPALDEVVTHLDACDECLSVVGAGSSRLPELPAMAARASIGARFAPGVRVANRYTIGRFVARGGMGEVYEAADDLLGLQVALKTVLSTSASDPRAVELLRREVRLARSITHPGVCRVFDLGEHPSGSDGDEKLLFLTMEYLEGITLGQRIRRQGPQPLALLLNVARQLASALAAAHAQGIVHRDFKSDNVMWLDTGEGASPRVVIMDFGLARSQAAGLTSTAGLVVGSAAYMAPEQVQGGPVDALADVYAFGVVLFEAATGRLPFVASTLMATAMKRLHEPPPRPRTIVPELHPALEEVILHCLARKPADRPASLNDVLAALAEVDEDPAATQAVRTQRVKRPVRRIGLALGAVVLGTVIAVALYTRADLPRPASVQSPPAVPLPTPATVPVTVDRAPSQWTAAPDAGSRVEASPARPIRPRRLAKQVGTPTTKPAPQPEQGPGRSNSTMDGFANPFR
jgi:serine/threonine protein kinase